MAQTGGSRRGKRVARGSSSDRGKAVRGMVVDPPVTQGKKRPSTKYIESLRELGASSETVQIATGERKFRSFSL